MIAAILDDEAAVYSQMDLSTAPLLHLKAGAEVEVGDSQNEGGMGWVAIALPDGRRGFVAGNTKIFQLKRAYFEHDVAAHESPSMTSGVKSRYKGGTPFFITQVVVDKDGKQWVRMRDFARNVGFIPGDTRVQDSREVVRGACPQCGCQYAVIESGLPGCLYKGASFLGLFAALIAAQVGLSAMGYREVAQAHYLSMEGLFKTVVAAGIFILVIMPLGFLLRSVAEKLLAENHCINCNHVATVREGPPQPAPTIPGQSKGTLEPHRPDFGPHRRGASSADAVETKLDEPMARLVRNLRSNDSNLRWNALESLSELGTSAKPAVSSLTDVLGDLKVNIRVKAAEALWRIDQRADAVIPVLLEALKGKDYDIHARGRAALILGRMGLAAKPAITELIAVSKDKSRYVRMQAAEALNTIDSDAAMKAGIRRPSWLSRWWTG